MKTLQELFNSLNGQEKKFIDGILPPHNTIDDLLSLSEDEFRQKLRNSLSPNDLGSLSDVEIVFRGELMDRVIKVWLSNRKKPIPTTEEDNGEDSEDICDNEGIHQDIEYESHGNSSLYKCYHKGCEFHTDTDSEYEKHGAQRHLDNPLLYPSKAEIEQFGLTPQGKEWEV